MEILYVYLGIYVLILITLSYITSKKEGKEGFLIAARNRKWWMLSSSKFAQAIGAGIFVTYTAYAYEFGLGIYTVIFGMLIGYLLFAFWGAPKIYEHSKDNKFYTQGDFVKYLTKNNFAKSLTNIASIVIVFIWLMTSIVAGAKIISSFGLMSYEVAVLATTVFIMVYILIAGYKAVLVTDVFQSIIIFFLLIFLSFALIKNESIISIFTTQTGGVDIVTVIGFLIFGVLSVFAYSNWFQLCYAAKDVRHLKRGIATSIIPIIITASFLLIIGLFMYMKDPNLDPGLVFIQALQLYLPVGLIPIGVVLFFAGLMSSCDTNIYAITSHYVLNSGKVKDPVKAIRKATILLSILVMIIAYFWRDIVDITVIAAAITITLSIPILYLLLGKTNHYRFIGSVFGGFVGLIVGIILLGIEPALMITVLVGSLLGLVYNRKKKLNK